MTKSDLTKRKSKSLSQKLKCSQLNLKQKVTTKLFHILIEKDRNRQEEANLQTIENSKQLYDRYEETNASLDRAFERISVLEADNNLLTESLNTEKQMKLDLQKEIDQLIEEGKRLKDINKRMELDKVLIGM